MYSTYMKNTTQYGYTMPDGQGAYGKRLSEVQRNSFEAMEIIIYW